MSDNIGTLSGIARPTGRAAAILRRGHSMAELMAMVEHENAIDALARILDVGFEKGLSSDGRLDLREVAAHVLKEVALRGKR